MLSHNVRKRMTQGSFTRKMFEHGNALKKKVVEESIFDLSLGNPIFEPPPQFAKELKNLLDSGQSGIHRYMDNAGYSETRAAVATQISKETGIKFKENDVVMTCGAAGGLNIILKSILNPGDEVIIFSPFFSEYDNYVNNHGGIVKLVPTDDDFKPRLDILDSSITSRTKALLINSPNNPTGIVYDEDTIVNITNLLKHKEIQLSTNIFLINDEAYKKLLYDGLKYVNIFKHYPRSIAVSSHSKDLSLPGERIGYVAVNPECDSHDELISALIFCNRILGFVNAPALMQHLIKKLQTAIVSIAEYQKNRDYLYENMIKLGYEIVKPQGAFYMFPKSPIADDISFVNELSKLNVLVVPGTGFGKPGYFRIAYCVDERTLKGALKGFKMAAYKYKLID